MLAKAQKSRAATLSAAVMLLSGISPLVLGSPTTDDCTQGNGCISLQNGGTLTFNFTASFDVGTHSQSGQLTFTDSSLAPGGVTLNSSLVLDYADLNATTRGLAFALNGGTYAEARVFVVDNGSAGDTFQLQLLNSAGVPVYDTLAQTLRADCGGGISVGNCVVPSPCQLEVTVACALLKSPNHSPADICTINGDSGEVTFFYSIKNTGSTAVPIASLTGSDSFGDLDFSSLGSGSLAPGQEVTIMVEEVVAGLFPFVNTVTISGGSTQCSAAATIKINQSGTNPPPAGECDDFVTGGGWIVGPSGAKANFGVHGGLRKGSFWGGLNYLDHGIGLHVKSTGVTGYTHLTDVGRQINFNVTINGQAGTAIVKVYDNGEPGRNDVFEISLSNGYDAAGDLGGARPGGGNLQLHKSKCKNNKTNPRVKK